MLFLEKYKTILIAGAAMAIGLFLFISKPKEEPVAQSEIPLFEEPQVQDAGSAAPEEGNEPMYVDVKGAVKTPGLYRVEEGDRMIDAITLAGGLTDKADEKQLNFAQKVHDEMVIYVPEKGEKPEDYPQTGQQSGGSQAASGQEGGKVNINKADASQLETLPGIGPAKAKAILDYREQQGGFKQEEDLKNVSGIGEKTFEKLQDSITVR
ncbi:helix-hairpin-helix domain-containing protein [Siminovitchia sp. 179-K 8D1 HS]|uniref:helix-hairpin-helix domain-containing protein n=1 Tax=Siminovitchia sp. 179-K 8D1 HS TaxID=3142385 RepID=UPI0039A16B24